MFIPLLNSNARYHSHFEREAAWEIRQFFPIHLTLTFWLSAVVGGVA